MKLSKKDRQEYIYRLKVLEALYPDDAESYQLQQKALQYGFTLHYQDVIEDGLWAEMDEDECRNLLDILSMYRALIFSYEDLGKPDEIKEGEIKFHGFDGNSETQKMAYVTYFMEDLGRFKEISNSSRGYYNSHSPMSNKYNRMLEKWNAVDDEKSHKMTVEQIKEILNA